MSNSVLLIDPDMDLLGELASQLRARGLEVRAADELERGLERARGELPRAVLVSADLAAAPDFLDRLAAIPGLLDVPRFRLVGRDAVLGPDELATGDPEAIASRVLAIAERSAGVADSREFRGDLAHVPIADLLQLLAANRRSGTLTLQTAQAAGEVRVEEGQIVDALYRRLEGKKALVRLLGEREGSFSFVSNSSAPLLRRIEGSTHVLMMEAVRQIDEAVRMRATLALEHDALIADAPPAATAPELEVALLELLTTPRTLDELLDEVPALDLEALTMLSSLLSRGAVRRVAGAARRVALADSERLGVLAALVRRVTRPGFRGPPRVAIVGSPRRLLEVMAALSRIADSSPPSDSVPAAPIPHVLATLRLPDSVELDVIGIPGAEAYLPLLGLVLPGCSSVAFADSPAPASVAEACELAGIPRFDASDALGAGLSIDAEQAAGVVRRLLERAVEE